MITEWSGPRHPHGCRMHASTRKSRHGIMQHLCTVLLPKHAGRLRHVCKTLPCMCCTRGPRPVGTHLVTLRTSSFPKGPGTEGLNKFIRRSQLCIKSRSSSSAHADLEASRVLVLAKMISSLRMRASCERQCHHDPRHTLTNWGKPTTTKSRSICRPSPRCS